MKKLFGLFGWLDLNLEKAVLITLLILITLAMTLQIIMRYMFNYSLMWPEEFNRLCFIVTAFFSLGYAIPRKKMLRVDIVMELVPKELVKVIDYMGKIISLGFYIYLFYGCIGVTANSYALQAKTPALELPWYIVYIMISIGFGMAVLRSIQELVIDVLAEIQS